MRISRFHATKKEVIRPTSDRFVRQKRNKLHQSTEIGKNPPQKPFKRIHATKKEYYLHSYISSCDKKGNIFPVTKYRATKKEQYLPATPFLTLESSFFDA